VPVSRIGTSFVVLFLAGCLATTPETGDGSKTAVTGAAGGATAQAANSILERCSESLGTLGVVEDQNAPWYHELRTLRLGSTMPVIRMMIQQSNCFVIVERGGAVQDMRTERDLGVTGEMHAGSNFGKGQRVAADYTMIPSIQFSRNTGALFGRVLGAVAGAVSGGMSRNEASTTLVMVDNRSGVQLAAAEGSAWNTDFKLLDGLFGGGLGAGAGGYGNTPEGKSIIAAFADSYNRLVRAVRNYRAQSREGGLGTGGSLGLQGGPPRHTTVTVHFATDRKDTGSRSVATAFLSDRGATVTYGTCNVSIPATHRLGQLETPSFRTLYQPSKERHVLLAALERQSESVFWQKVRDRMPSGTSGSVLIFVHGYNLSFEDAARRTAQVAHDINFQGVPMFFSWPSGNTLERYLSDSSNVEWSEIDLRAFLHDVVRKSGAQDIFLLAHSMGSRALTRAWVSLSSQLRPEERSRVREIILAAPDIDADYFRRSLVPSLVQAGVPVTLYASGGDMALKASKAVNGFPRAGDAGEGLVVAPGIETVDATEVDSSTIGHGYVLDVRAMLADVASLLKRERANQRFGLMPVDDERGRFWRIRR